MMKKDFEDETEKKEPSRAQSILAQPTPLVQILTRDKIRVCILRR